MAMSGANSKTSSKERIIKLDNEDEKTTVSKPCIDFQPDDRWQINDEVSDKVKQNPRINDIKNSANGSARTLRSRSKPNQPILNGESISLSSDEEEKKKVERLSDKSKLSVNTSNECNNKKNLKRRISLRRESKTIDSNKDKKAKIAEVELSDIDDKKCDDEDDSNDKLSMPNLSPAANDCSDNDSKVVQNLDDSIVMLDENSESLENDTDDDSSRSSLGRNKNESLPKLEEFNSSDNKVKHVKENSCNDVSSGHEKVDNVESKTTSSTLKEMLDEFTEDKSTSFTKSSENENESLEKSLKNKNESLEKTSKNEEECLEKSSKNEKECLEKSSKDEKDCLEKSSKDEKECLEKSSKNENGSCEKSSKNENESSTNSNKEASNSEIEVINILDESKKSSENSDDESDSEIQILNSEENSKPLSPDFPPGTDFQGDFTLSAGYPYFNSLKEKISGFKAGEYKPVKFPHPGTLFLAENEVIIESPSLLVPLLIKEADEFPAEGKDKKANGEESITAKPTMISKRNFFQSSVGQFLINLGMSRVQEFYQGDMKRLKQKQLRKSPNDPTIDDDVKVHEKRQRELKEINAVFNFRVKRCQFCNFKSESRAVMEGHYLTPHISSRREYRCNFCAFMTRDPKEIMFHFEAMHGKKAIVEFNVPFHECIFCSFQSHLKTKVNAHMNRCRKHFIPSQNLSPPFDFEFPGVTTKAVTIADVIAHRRLLLSSAKNQRLPLPDDNSPQGAYARKKLASVLSKLSGQGAFPDLKNPNLMKHLMATQTQQLSALSSAGIQLPPGIVITRPRFPGNQIRPGRFPMPPRAMATLRPPPRRGPIFTNSVTSSTTTQLASSGISITPVTRPSGLSSRTNSVQGLKNVTLTPISSASNRNVSQKPGPPQPVALFSNIAGNNSALVGQPPARLPSTSARLCRPTAPYQRLNTPPSQLVKGSSGNTFVMCEICDSYIKDLEELRSHMNWVHKVKIHPKMLVSRPPLNCQKCQWRFFTDQGLERHLLGAHGLVTTNMQEMANKNQDGGRCIICGAVFTYKLVSHMTQMHKVTLKPAHLSYKCTVCTATFTLYRLFESHVYNVHSGSAKRPADDLPSEPPAKKVVKEKEAAGPQKCKECGLVTENIHDHLVSKHLKKCSVKLCQILQCEKCLNASGEMLVIRMEDLGLMKDSDSSDDDSSDDDSEDDQDSSSESSSKPSEELKEDAVESKESATKD